uniref:GumC family protein n=1 Tax=Shimia ponticola TaxID=2582893 RepID=UPI002103D866
MVPSEAKNIDVNTQSQMQSSRSSNGLPVAPHVGGSGTEDFELWSLVLALWRGKWWIMICVVIAMLIGGYYAYRVAVPIYTARTTLVLESQQANVVDVQSVIGGPTGSFVDIATEVEVMRGRTLMGKVVDRLDLTSDPEFNGALRPPGRIAQLRASLLGNNQPQETTPTVAPEVRAARARERAVNVLLRRVSVSNIRQTYVFQISAVSQSPQKAALIADTMAELYILEQLQVKFDATEQATLWLTERVTELKTQLENAEAAVAEFSASADLVSVEALQVQEIQLKDIRDRLTSLSTDIIMAQSRLAALEAAETREDRAALANDIQLTRLLPQVATDAQARRAFDQRFEQA